VYYNLGKGKDEKLMTSPIVTYSDGDHFNSPQLTVTFKNRSYALTPFRYNDLDWHAVSGTLLRDGRYAVRYVLAGSPALSALGEMKL